MTIAQLDSFCLHWHPKFSRETFKYCMKFTSSKLSLNRHAKQVLCKILDSRCHDIYASKNFWVTVFIAANVNFIVKRKRPWWYLFIFTPVVLLGKLFGKQICTQNYSRFHQHLIVLLAPYQEAAMQRQRRRHASCTLVDFWSAFTCV